MELVGAEANSRPEVRQAREIYNICKMQSTLKYLRDKSCRFNNRSLESYVGIHARFWSLTWMICGAKRWDLNGIGKIYANSDLSKHNYKR